MSLKRQLQPKKALQAKKTIESSDLNKGRPKSRRAKKSIPDNPPMIMDSNRHGDPFMDTQSSFEKSRTFHDVRINSKSQSMASTSANNTLVTCHHRRESSIMFSKGYILGGATEKHQLSPSYVPISGLNSKRSSLNGLSHDRTASQSVLAENYSSLITKQKDQRDEEILDLKYQLDTEKQKNETLNSENMQL